MVEVAIYFMRFIILATDSGNFSYKISYSIVSIRKQMKYQLFTMFSCTNEVEKIINND